VSDLKTRWHAVVPPPLAAWLLSLALLLLASLPMQGTALAQLATSPGVRGWLYESPTYGWLLIAQQPEWRIANASSADGVDGVHLVSNVGSGADDYFISVMDDGRGAEGCARDLVQSLAAAYPDTPLQGWHGPEVEYSEIHDPDEFNAYASVPNDDPDQVILAYIQCHRGEQGLLIGETLLRTARDVNSPTADLPLLAPIWPGDGHTGHARGSASPDGVTAPGVVRFLARGWAAGESGYPFPFSCIDQESFTRPSEPPPPDRGWFVCDGQIANVDVVPATIDLQKNVLGCAPVPTGEPLPSGCAGTLVAPNQYEVLSGPPGVTGPNVTLAPGESLELALWYALPGGDAPLEIFYQEPDRTVVVGPTFFTEGTGSRPRVRLGR
jgi:hypothetical protein